MLSRSVLPTLCNPLYCDPMDCSPPLSVGFPSKHTGVGCHFLLQGIFPIKPAPHESPALAGRFFTTEPPEALIICIPRKRWYLTHKMLVRTYYVSSSKALKDAWQVIRIQMLAALLLLLLLINYCYC